MDFENRKQLMLDLGLDLGQIQRIADYIQVLWSSNSELNLISRKMTMNELIDNHVIDCLLPFPYFPKNLKSVADLGTGGGLPGVLYALLFPQTQFFLFEKSIRKQEFLKKLQSMAPNLEIYGEIPLDVKSPQLVIARAFKPVDVILDLTSKYFLNGGKYFLLKGRLEKIEEELSSVPPRFKNLKAESIKLISPVLEVERHLLLIEKSTIELDKTP